VHEAVVARVDAHSVEVTTTQPAARGERLVLQFRDSTGEVTAHVANVVSCTPHTSADGTQWRLMLTLVPVGLEPQAAR
jgi:hypothetical protein